MLESKRGPSLTAPTVVGTTHRPDLVGRRRERELLDQHLDSARAGRGVVLVVHGDPGVGKTALLEYAVQRGDAFRIARTVGVEGELALPFAALQQLCAPILALRMNLPPPQRDALDVAFGLAPGGPPSPFLVGLAVLGLLSEAAEDRPVLCVVDDAQWLDQASAAALAFIARRLVAEKVALLFATRAVGATFVGLPELRVEPLGHEDARALLAASLPAPVDAQVLEQVVAETRGNPLGLLELPRGLTPAQLAGGFGLPAAVPVHGAIEELFAQRLAALPPDARLLLLVAAADATGDAALMWRAAQHLGLNESAARAIEAEELATFGDGVTFRHPLVRSAVYRAAGPDERARVHRALADAIGQDTDPDRRAWHRGQGALMPDDNVADDLERSAVRARARGGFAAAAAFLERSSVLTLDPARRAGRALAAAQARQQAGEFDGALSLAATAEAGPLDKFQRAQADVLRARIFFATDRGRKAPSSLLVAAKRVESLDTRLAREIYLDALTAAVFAGRLAGEFDARHVAVEVRAAPPSAPPVRAADLLLDGLALLITEGHAAGIATTRKALERFRGDDVGTADELRWFWLAGRTAAFIWDYDAWESLTSRQVRSAREVGALAELPLALVTRVGVHLFAGDLRAAESLVAESDALAAVTDARLFPPYGRLGVAASRGREEAFTRLLRTSVADFNARGEGMGLTMAHWLTAFLYNSLARYDDAFAAAVEACADPDELWFSNVALVELVEAASRSGRSEKAAEALALLSESTRASGTPWALAVEARSRALLQQGPAAESLYREAVELLRPTRLRLDLARSHLVYGEWLRRERRRVDARNELRLAYEMFTEAGMDAFSERARVELQATGEHARRRTVDTLDQLTPQEAQVSRLAAQGSTNREIAAQLFISPSTVEYHLRKAFRKLEVTSRVQLARRMR
jgi:DNA-binding CsgD family transcriptional regulator